HAQRGRPRTGRGRADSVDAGPAQSGHGRAAEGRGPWWRNARQPEKGSTTSRGCGRRALCGGALRRCDHDPRGVMNPPDTDDGTRIEGPGGSPLAAVAAVLRAGQVEASVLAVGWDDPALGIQAWTEPGDADAAATRLQAMLQGGPVPAHGPDTLAQAWQDQSGARLALLVRVATPSIEAGAAWAGAAREQLAAALQDRKSTRLNSSHVKISYAVFCLKKKRQ